MNYERTTEELEQAAIKAAENSAMMGPALEEAKRSVWRALVAMVALVQVATKRPPARPASKPMDSEPLMDARQLANVLGWSEATAYRKAKTGEIPSVKLGKRSSRFRFSEVETALRNGN